MRTKREHTNPLPEPDLERHASDTERGYGTPATERVEEPRQPVTRIEQEPEPGVENVRPPADDRSP